LATRIVIASALRHLILARLICTCPIHLVVFTQFRSVPLSVPKALAPLPCAIVNNFSIAFTVASLPVLHLWPKRLEIFMEPSADENRPTLIRLQIRISILCKFHY
jgi:hypothetical protein